MYVFSDEMRKTCEAMPMACAYVQCAEGKAVPLLVSDGFCHLSGMDREQSMKWLADVLPDALCPESGGDSPLDLLLPGDGRRIRVLGRLQTMPDGTELVLLECSCFQTDPVSGPEDQFYRDTLTGLPNLNYLNRYAGEKLSDLKAQGSISQVIYIDVISMQFYNSQYGYVKGNELLCLAARSLREVFPEGLIIRGAEDHFIVMDAFESRERTEAQLTRVNREIRRRAEGETTGIRAGICIGEEGIRNEELLDRARNALKWIGNDLNQVCSFHTEEAEEAHRNRQYVRENFDRALENGWIRVYYQGIARTDTGKSTALEALARWADPDRGLLSPAVFIPVLEEYHLLHRLDLFMAEQVCRDMLLREERGLPILPVTVNFSAQDFDYADIPERLSGIYSRYCPDLHPEKKYLIVEITEQDMARATDRFHDQLRQLREMGFRIWLDDFGSGYSSLNVFSRLDVNLIKFDMDLLRDLDSHNGANRRIMHAMVQIARELGIHTLAEGLETEQQRAFLQEIGCELAQGFYFHRPEPLAETLRRMEEGQTLRPFESPEEREKLNGKWFEEYEQRLSVIEQFGHHMPGGFFICSPDGDGELLYANQAVWQIFGCETLEDFRSLTGFTLRGMVHPEDWGRIEKAVREDAEEDRRNSLYMEYRVVRRDGESRWVGEYSYLVPFGPTRRLYYIFLSDVTEKHLKAESEKALRSSVIEALTRPYDAVWLIHDMESQRFDLYRIDETMAHFVPAREAVNMPRFSDALVSYSELVAEEDRERFLQAVTPERITEGTENLRTYSVPYRRVFENSLRHYRLEFARLDLGNGEFNIVGGFRDVDEEVRRDQEIQDSLHLRSAVIEALTRPYDSVWLIRDLKTQSFELFRIDEEMQHRMPARDAAKISRFRDALSFYSRFILEEDRQSFLEATTPEKIAANTENRLMYSVPFRRVFGDGIRYYRLEFTRLELGQGRYNVVGGFRNVDEEVRRDLQIQQSLTQRSAVIEALTRPYDSVWLIHDMKEQRFELYRIDEEMAHLMPASAAAKITRFSDALLFYSKLVLEEDRERFLEALTPERIMEGTENRHTYSVPFRRVFESGVRYYRLELARLEEMNGETCTVGGFKNVDEEVRRDLQLHKALQDAMDLAETDQMTGVYHRTAGESRVTELLENGRHGMFVLFDIDHFKHINDQYGHTMGDQVILLVSGCLKETFRDGDIVMRLGGDEFAVFAPGVHTRRAGERILSRYYEHLNRAVERENMVRIGVSAGAAFSSEKEMHGFRHLYESADRAMYESKRFHDGRATFSEGEDRH